MKLHPVHLLLVHFPAALLPMDLIFSLIHSQDPKTGLASASYYCLMAGVIGGWIALITGGIDLFRYVLKSQEVKRALIHGCTQVCVVFSFTILLSLEFKQPLLIADQPVWLLTTKAVLCMLMFIGNYFGAEVLFNAVATQFRSPKI
jgi:uncharacterized membrane protein